MSRVHSKSGRVLVNSSHLSGDVKSWNFEHRRNYGEVTNILGTGEEWIPGQLAGSVGIVGNFNSGAGNFSTVMDTAAASEAAFLTTIGPSGVTVGALAFIADGNISARSVDAAVKEAVAVSITGTANDGVDMGVWLEAMTARTADGNGTGVDNTAASTAGGVGSVHVTAFSGFSGAVLKVQHSTDNVSFSDLITFTTATTTTWERKAVTGIVNRYVRALWDITGSGSITFAMAFARR
jgi:hypothetical protein